MHKDYEFKKVGMGRYARAVYLTSVIGENSPIVFGKTDIPEDVFNKAYHQLKHSWKEFVELVIVEPNGLSDFDEIGVDVPEKVMAGFTKAAAGIVPKSSPASETSTDSSKTDPDTIQE